MFLVLSFPKVWHIIEDFELKAKLVSNCTKGSCRAVRQRAEGYTLARAGVDVERKNDFYTENE